MFGIRSLADVRTDLRQNGLGKELPTPVHSHEIAPVMRRILARVSTSGVFLLCEWGLRRGGVAASAGTGAARRGFEVGWMTAKAR